MNANDYIEIIPFSRLSEMNRLWSEWLHSRGLHESLFRGDEVVREVGRGQFEHGHIGSFSIIRIRRSALERVLPDEYGGMQPH